MNDHLVDINNMIKTMREIIDRICRDREITRIQLAKELGVSRATLYRWTKKTPHVITKLSKYINNTAERGI